MERQLWEHCSIGRVEEVRKLLQNPSINTNWQDAKYWTTPFFIACYYGQTEVVKLLFNDERVDVNKTRNDGWTPFIIACWNGHVEIVKLLVNNSRVDPSHVNRPTGHQQTPFLLACQKGHNEIVKYLLACGREIDLDKIDNDGKTALGWARQFNNVYLVQLIESFQRDQNETRARLRKELELQSESTYRIEYNQDMFKLKTIAKTLLQLESDLRSKLELQQNEKLVLKYNENGKMYILKDVEDLEEGMTIHVSSTNYWWDTKPIKKIDWEEKGHKETKYIQYLLRDNKRNVVDNGNGYLKKLEILMTFFGGDMNRVNKAYVIFNEKLFNSFQNQRSFLSNQHKSNPGKFKKDDWKNGNDRDQKHRFHDHYTDMAEEFVWNRSKELLHAVPMIHGTSENVLHDICQTGLAPTGETDPGFFGQGMYFSSSLLYSSNYAKAEEKLFIICMVTPGNVYPVTESPYLEGPIGSIKNPEGFMGSACKPGYQSHYTLVKEREYEYAFPIKGNIDGGIANELVVFDRAQVLPLFAIYYE